MKRMTQKDVRIHKLISDNAEIFPTLVDANRILKLPAQQIQT